MEFPYTDFVIVDSLSLAIRSQGLSTNNSTPVITPPNPIAQFDALCDAVAKSFGCSLYLDDKVRKSKNRYNTHGPASNTNVVFIERSPEAFIISPQQQDTSCYSRYEATHAITNLEELEKAPENIEKITEDFTEEALGWFYDVFKNDPKSPYSTIPRNVYPADLKESASSVPRGEIDMIIQCPEKDVIHVLGYSSRGMITFPKSTLYTNKLSTPILRVPDGLGICLVAGAQEIFLLSSSFNPILAFQFIPQFVRFVKAIGVKGCFVTVLDDPIPTKLDEIIDADIEAKYGNLRVGTNIVQGECTYDYEALDRDGIPQSSTINHLVSRWGITKPILCVKESFLCMNLHTLERIIEVINEYLPRDRSVIYKTIERFVNFLYRVGYSGEIPQYENLTDAFVAYQNIKVINSQLVTKDGTLTIDMSPFSKYSRYQELCIRDWKETNSNVSYTV